MASVPDEPDNTCPKIDKVIKTLERVTDALGLEPWEDLLEEIRSANADLRERAQHYEQEAGEANEAKDEAIEERDRLQVELAGTSLAIANLTSRVAELEAARDSLLPDAQRCRDAELRAEKAEAALAEGIQNYKAEADRLIAQANEHLETIAQFEKDLRVLGEVKSLLAN